jgi:hypothetical protein
MGQWIDIAAFQPNAIGTFGNAGRNIITGPRIWSTSATVVRSFTIHEGHRLEFRWGMSNPFNNIYLTAPTQWTLSGAASFGVCGVSGPRTMSLGLKYLF